MKELTYGDYRQTLDKLRAADDDEIISDFLIAMVKGFTCEQFHEEDNIYNINPNDLLLDPSGSFVFVKNPRDPLGVKNDDGAYDCWRSITCDKLIHSKKTDKLLGVKKILKFCIKTMPRGYKRAWVMEEYRLLSEWAPDFVICKLSMFFDKQITFLIDKHFSLNKHFFSRLLKTNLSLLLPETQYLPVYGDLDRETHLYCISGSGDNLWPEVVTTDVYNLDPFSLVDVNDRKFWLYGVCFFANSACRRTDGCHMGSWRMVQCEKIMLDSTIEGFRKVFNFKEKGKGRYVFREGSYRKITFYVEEYRVAIGRVNRNKVICVMKAKTRTI